MNLRFIERDGKKILQESQDVGYGLKVWQDVPCVKESPKTLAERLEEVIREHRMYDDKVRAEEIVSIVREHILDIIENNPSDKVYDKIRELK